MKRCRVPGESKTPAWANKMLISRGYLSRRRVCLPSFESSVQTFIAKSCSFGRGERRDRASLS